LARVRAKAGISRRNPQDSRETNFDKGMTIYIGFFRWGIVSLEKTLVDLNSRRKRLSKAGAQAAQWSGFVF
jgi:hypothetical protein